MFDFTTVAFDLQGAFAGAVVAMLALALKIVLFGIAVQFISLFAPRWLRPLAVLAALTLLVAFPAQLAQIADVLLARAGLLPQAVFPVVPAGAAPGALAGVQGQVQGTLDSFITWMQSQLRF